MPRIVYFAPGVPVRVLISWFCHQVGGTPDMTLLEAYERRRLQ